MVYCMERKESLLQEANRLEKEQFKKTDSPFAGLLQKGWGTKSGERSFCCPFGEMGQRRCGL